MKKILLFGFVAALIYSRFVGLDWGLPYPMHPDERNIVLSIQQLQCDFNQFALNIEWFKSCYNPEFFAYGQPTIYTAAILAKIWNILQGDLIGPISFNSATLALRFISAIASILNVYVLYRTLLFILRDSIKKNKHRLFLAQISLVIFAFSPYFIQFSHFGTTESVLMLLYSLILHYSLVLNLSLLKDKKNKRHVIWLGILLGLSVAVKVSSIIFVALPVIAVIFSKLRLKKKLFFSCLLLITSIIVGAFFSHQSILQWSDFMGSMSYETNVGRGIYKAFYTRQFEFSIPGLFHMFKVFPYALGMGQFLLFVLGVSLLSWKNRCINFLRIAFFVFFIPTCILYAKWTRFSAPVFPIMTLLSVVFLITLVDYFLDKVDWAKKYIAFILIAAFVSIPGIAYIHIYQTPDVRFQASEWIYKNIPEGSKILSETANVVDIPMPSRLSTGPKPAYSVVSFDFYHLDGDTKLKEDLKNYVSTTDYIFMPSRRLFANHTCTGPLTWNLSLDTKLSFEENRCDQLYKTYPTLNEYYLSLLDEESTFTQIAEFSSYPQITIFGKNIIVFPDERAEETWTVFDHPVIRIYQRS